MANGIDTIKGTSGSSAVADSIEPTPSPEQIALWDALDEVFDADALEHEEFFTKLPTEKRNQLASVGFSEDVARVAARFSFDPDRARDLARIVRYLSLELIKPSRIDEIGAALDLTGENANTLARELRALLNIPEPAVKDEIRMPEASPEITIIPTPTPTEIPSPAPEETIKEPAPAATPSIDTVQTKPVPEKKEEPFMLHEEQQAFTRDVPKWNPTVRFESKSDPKSMRSGSKAAKAKVETPEGEAEEARVVHYSDLQSSIDRE